MKEDTKETVYRLRWFVLVIIRGFPYRHREQ